MDGKHIIMQAPANSGSLFFNYKHSFSIVLMAIVDPWKRFICVEVGDVGSNSDGAVFQNSIMGKRIMENKMGFPPDKCLPGLEDRGKVPHCIVADEAFPLRTNVMRPYPGRKKNLLSDEQKIFNYRQSRPRLRSEHGFGGVAQKFRICHRKINLNPDSTRDVVLACVALHNYLTKVDYSFMGSLPDEDPPPELESSEALNRLAPNTAHNASQNAVDIRDLYAEYFCSPIGRVPWQYKSARVPEPDGALHAQT
jgi:hypothetical protein